MSSSVPSPVIVACDAMFLKMLSKPHPTDFRLKELPLKTFDHMKSLTGNCV